MARYVKPDVPFPADAGILYQPGINPTVSLMREEKKKLTVNENYAYLILDKHIKSIWILICILFANSVQQLKHEPSTSQQNCGLLTLWYGCRLQDALKGMGSSRDCSLYAGTPLRPEPYSS